MLKSKQKIVKRLKLRPKQTEPTATAKINNGVDFQIYKNSTETKTESKVSSSASSIDESKDKVIASPSKPVKHLSETFKTLSIN